ncbi:monovalent cation/H(+) antiporter subunit G [Halolamina sp.]|jgi:multicomponent Na+:H+ antiporter subunit G|uniref:monovalent cation/H(+) antiporter subunit G n=1 Tax=Halolamina sp. TaxID=1940283 RepID=UPI000223BBD4|nr:monovalent cation/proton antiporter, MnhG/PhaG subunit [halophilic archaeon DL31]
MIDPVLIPLLAEGTEAATSSGGGGLVGLVQTALVSLLVGVGIFFLGVGTLGMLRLPNVYNRMHATTKATTMGSSSIAVATWVYYAPAGEGLPALVTVLFLFLTAPTGAHLISRSAARMDIEFLEGVSWPGPTDQHSDSPEEE